MSEGLVLASRYRLIHQLGAGGMGSVWLAQDLNLDTEVAIKLIDPTIAESSEAVGRFRQEAQAAAMIRSSHVVQILDHGIDQGRPFIAMELLRGENLGQRLEQQGHLSPAQTGHVLGQVGRALSLAHSRGIVHRDLKPDNIFLVSEGDEEIAKVLDFGVARRMGGLTDSSLSKTRTGAMLGTPYYMSPEQATGQAVDHLSDIWSFGVIALECLTGARAFDGDSVGALFHGICMLPLPVASQLGVVPAGFDEWFARAVNRDLTKRFSSIRQAADELRQLCGRHSGSMLAATMSGSRIELSSYAGLTTTAVSAVSTEFDQTAPPSTKTLSGRLRKRPVATGLGVAALLCVGVLGLWLRPGAQPASPLAGAAASAPIPRVPAPDAKLDAPAEHTDILGAAAQPSAPPTAPASSTEATLASASASTPVAPLPVKAALVTKLQAKTLAPNLKERTLTDKTKRNDKKSFIKRDDNAAGI